MTREKFASQIKADKRLGLVDGEALARELTMHIGDGEAIRGWMVLKERKRESNHEQKFEIAIVSDNHFILVHVDGFRTGVLVNHWSAPIGRLRAINTDRMSGDREGEGGFCLDFAPPVFGEDSAVVFRLDKGWPTDEARTFLAAVAAARK